ncbi:MAG: DUF6174 domain-containing protein [Treponema sp.]|nr:DUF6174 domain-containing protein [Treponema sp.]
MKKVLLAAMANALLYACAAHESLLLFDNAAFDKAQADWAAHGIADYVFEVEEFVAGPRPAFRVTVLNGETANIELVDDTWYDGSLCAEDRIDDDFARIWEIGTIPAVFNRIKSLEAKGASMLHSLRKGAIISLRVTYSSGYGFPKEMSWDVFTGGVGNGYDLEIRNFRPIAK